MVAHDALPKIVEQPVEFGNRRHCLRRARGDSRHPRLPATAPGAEARRRSAAPEPFDDLGQRRDDRFGFPEVLELLQTLDAHNAELVALRVFFGAGMSEIAEMPEFRYRPATADLREPIPNSGQGVAIGLDPRLQPLLHLRPAIGAA